MDTLNRGDISVGLDRRWKSETAFAESSKNNDLPDSNCSKNQNSRHSGRYSYGKGKRSTAPASPKNLTKSEYLAPWSARDKLSSATTMSHRRQTTIGGKFGFVAFEDILSDVISVCPQMTSWLNDSLDNVVCINNDLESSKEKALPAFYYSNTSAMGPNATAGYKCRSTTMSLTANANKTDYNNGSCPSQTRIPAGRRSKNLLVKPDDKCFARSSSSLLVIYEPDF